MIVDPNVELTHQASEKLIARYGGFQGWLDHLQAVQDKRDRAQAAKKKRSNSRAKTKSLSAPIRRTARAKSKRSA